MTPGRLGLFDAFGVELEYMIVDRQTLGVRPIADRVLMAGARSAEPVSDAEVPETGIGWSNELVLHVIELKTVEPVPALAGLPARFADSVRRVNRILSSLGARLMPSAMHPLMDPARDMRLWPHDNAEIYAAFDRIFGCTGHGWSNLQSVHLNLPFRGDEEFGRLHAAVRLILPMLPALAASSPMMDGRVTGVADNRLAVYRTNARRVPSVSGQVIPEPVFTRADYQARVLEGIYADLRPLDPEGLLREEWVNARGAIARFSRNSIEVRVLDVQETPGADVAICAAIVAVLRNLVAERWSPLARQQAWETAPLHRILLRTIDRAEEAVISERDYLDALGVPASLGAAPTAGAVWDHLVGQCVRSDPGAGEFVPALDRILRQGTLSTRLRRRLGPTPSPERVTDVYRELCECLPSAARPAGGMFDAPA